MIPNRDSGAPDPRTRKGWPWLGPSICAALSAILSLPLLGFGFTFDQGVFSTLADTMLRGGVAYRDAWEHKPPGVLYVYYLSFLLIKREIWAVRVVEILMLAASSAGLFKLVERRTGSSLAGWVSAVVLPLTYLNLGQNTAQAESFQIPFIIAAFLVWPGAGEAFRVSLRCFASGCLIGVAVLFKTPGILIAAVFLIERICWDRRQKENLGKVQLTLITALGMLAPLLLLFAYYGARGAGGALHDALFIYPVRYASAGMDRSFASQASAAVAWMSWLVPFATLLLILLGVIRGCFVRRIEVLRWVVVFLASWGSVAIQGRYFSYHHLPLLPALAWGAGLLFCTADGRLPTRSKPDDHWVTLVPVAGFALIAISMVQYFWWDRPHAAALGRWATFDQPNGIPDDKQLWSSQREVARRIRGMTRAEDRIYIWGDAPLVYAMADRRMAGRHAHLMQVVPPWQDPQRLSAQLERLAREMPQIVVVCPESLWWRKDQTPKELLKAFPAMQQFIVNSYRMAGSFKGYELWVHIDGG